MSYDVLRATSQPEMFPNLHITTFLTLRAFVSLLWQLPNLPILVELRELIAFTLPSTSVFPQLTIKLLLASFAS